MLGYNTKVPLETGYGEKIAFETQTDIYHNKRIIYESIVTNNALSLSFFIVNLSFYWIFRNKQSFGGVL